MNLPLKFSLFLIFLIMCSCHQKIINVSTHQVYNTSDFGFAQANIYDGLLFTSGQVGWDPSYQQTGDGNFSAQLQQSFKNLQLILHTQKCDFKEVIHLRFYVKGLDKQRRLEIGRQMTTQFQDNHLPSSTLIGVSNLAREELLIEIELIAKTNR